jgi:uncharacterized protein (TIGR02231 family)
MTAPQFCFIMRLQHHPSSNNKPPYGKKKGADMRNDYFSALTALSCLLFSASSAAANAPITDVLLFPGGATITRTVQVNPEMTQVVISNLPSNFDMQSLRAEAGAGIRIGEIVSNDTAKTDAVNPAEAALEAKIAALHDEQEVLDADAKSAQMVIDFLTRLGSGDASGPDARRSPPPDAKTLTALIGVMGAEGSKALAKMQKIAVRKREIARKIDSLQRDLARLRTGERETRTLTVNLSADRAGVLTVSYQVANAGWKPAYRASLNSETSKLELERQAIISQKTGEDWNNVRLTLSTSQPLHTTSGAEPQPWLLSYQSPQTYSSYETKSEAVPMAAPQAQRMRVAKKPGVGDDQAAMEEVEQEPPYTPPTTQIQTMFATQFQVPARTSLAADGREVSVALSKETLTVKQYLQTTPRLETAAYVTAAAEKPEGDWPAGNMQLFRDGSFIGSNFWNPQAKDRLILGFGRDEQVHVAVVPLKTDTASSGVFGKREHRKIATVFNITNHHKRPVNLTVLEAAPVSTSDEVKVTAAFDPKPGRETWEDKRGVMAWEMTIAPGATSKIKTEYEIEFPREGTLIGGR